MIRILRSALLLTFFTCLAAMAMAANATLSALTVSSGALSPAFTSAGTAYTVTLSSSVASVTFKPTQTTLGSTITVNGTAVTSGTNSGAIVLSPGSNIVTIRVSKVGLTTVNYVITVVQEGISYAGSPFTLTKGSAMTLASSTQFGDNPTNYAGALPAGLSINPLTGDISGTPTVVSAATAYTITATYAGGQTATTGITITVNPAPPVISYTPSTNTYLTGTAITPLNPANTGGAATGYSVSSGLPAGLSINAITGVISGTPTAVTASATYTITATNAGGSGSTNITLTINPPAPAISYTPAVNTLMVGTLYSLSPVNTGGASATWTISGSLPSGMTFDPVTGVIWGAPSATFPTTVFTVTASNATGTNSTTITITCVNPPAPIISITPSTVVWTVGTPITPITPTNSGGAASNFTISPSLPAGMTFNITTGTITGTPSVVTAGIVYTVKATNAGGSSTATVTITINPQAPSITYTPSTNIYTVGTAISPLTPVNTGGAASSYSISAVLPAGLSFNTSTGVISGTPTVVSPSTNYNITATNVSGSSTTTVNLTVNPAPPVISYSPSTVVYIVGTTITPLTASNTGGAAASYSVSPALPAGLIFNAVTGAITGTPTTVTAAANYTVTATNAGGTSTAVINITVNPAAPAISYTPSTNVYTVGTPIATLSPVNTGGPSTNYIIGPILPPGLSFNTTTGVITGTPTSTSPVTTYTISADNVTGVSTTTVTLSCINPTAPIISYTPSANTYQVGTAITTLTPANTGGPAVSWSINTPLPSGLSFSTTTGAISGTPAIVSATKTYTVTATNAAGSGTTTVTITVNPPPPVISYSPSVNTYTIGSALVPLVPNNSGGTATSFSISSALPAGLTFNTFTGIISGTPTALSAAKVYTITASNASGSGTTTVTISVNNLAPSISYSPSTVSTSVGSTISPITPTSTAGAPASYSINKALPAGFSFDTTTGIITGTATAVFPTTTFTITATNIYGSSNASLILTVSPHAPIISYNPSTNAYPVNIAIPTLTPTNTGGAVIGFSYGAGVAVTGATLSGPSLMTTDAAGNIYVANYGNKTISKYSPSNVYLGTFGSGITFTTPCGIVFDSAGNAYVMDTQAGAVYKLNSSGVYQSTILTGLGHPLGISIDASNNIYLATYNTGTGVSSVNKYNTTGAVLLTVSTTGMNGADGVTVDPAGNIYVLNRFGNNVTEYDALGNYIGVFSSGYNDPLAVASDAQGDIFVGDSHNNQIKVYSNSGVLLNTLSGFGDVEGFVADASGNLYVSDYTGNTVKEFPALGGWHISAPLPPGLSFNSSTGQITGTPTTVFPPTTYTVTAYNITGSGTTTVTLSCYDSYDWVGVTSTDWNTPSNWLSGVVPNSASAALIGVNRAFNFFPNILAGSGTVSVGSVSFGTNGGKAAGVVINTGSTLNVLGAVTYQSDANALVGYNASISGVGTMNAATLAVTSNTVLTSSYSNTLNLSVANLNVSGNIVLTTSNSGSNIFNSTLNIAGGTVSLAGIVQTTNSATSTASLTMYPIAIATLNLTNATALSGLSGTGTNVVTFNQPGATVQYSGAGQTVYSSAAITGLPSGVSYQNISFSGTGIETALSGNLNIAGDFVNTMANNGANYADFSAPNVNFMGTTQNICGGGGNGTVFYNVTFGGAGTKSINCGQVYIASTGVLTMSGNSAATILAAGGLLTLNSDAGGSATVAPIPAGPSITGTVNVQRYLTGGAGYRGYRLTSSPVYAATVTSNNVYSVNYLKNNVYLAGNAGGGFDKVGNPSIFLFREDYPVSNSSFISGNWWGITAINKSPLYNYDIAGQTASGSFYLPSGTGFLFFFRGDRTAATIATESQSSYAPVSTTLSASGTLNQGQVTVHNWYTPGSSYLNYTGSGLGGNVGARGFNLVGNPYASSIDWEQFNTSSTTTGIYGNNVSPTVYEFNPRTQNYDTYQKGGAFTNHGRRIIVSGEAFFVTALNAPQPQLIFNESAKSLSQSTGLNLFMTTKNDLANLDILQKDQHLRIQMSLDSVNTDDTYIGFTSQAHDQSGDALDAAYRPGYGKVSIGSISSDHIVMAINSMPLPGTKRSVIPLYITSRAYTSYKLNLTEQVGIPEIYRIWLKDNFTKDSVDFRQNPTYAFSIVTDTNSYGSHRFELVMNQDTSLGVHLLNFTGAKTTGGSQLKWLTNNEETYTRFTLERSNDGGQTYHILAGFSSYSAGSYSFLDRAPALDRNLYRLKLEDLNGTITYSKVVTLMYASTGDLANSAITIYPNPAKTTINLSITSPIATTSSYNVEIVNAAGAIVKTATISQTQWQGNIGSLMPGSYVLQVVDGANHSMVGRGVFIKL